MKDLRERYARCELVVSAPIAAFRESAADAAAERSAAVASAASAADAAAVPPLPKHAKVVEVSTPGGAVTLRARAAPLPGALAAARRSRRLQPRDGALAADEVIKLCRLGRLVEAEELLRNTAAASPAERTVLAPAWAELLVRTRRWEEGRRQLGELLAARPSDQHLRLLLGRVEQYAGNEAGAEREFRKILAADPAHRESLEALVGLLTRSGRQEAADQASLAAVAAQPRNHSNNLRAAILAETRGDRAAVIRLLLAAERSGPVNAALEMHLAGQLYQAGQADPALAHLATARRLALIEGDAITLDSVQQRLARLQAHAGPAR